MGASSDECRARMLGNAVYKSMKMVERIADQVASGARKNAVVSGPTGIGKNFIFERAFERHGLLWQPERPVSEAALIEHIEENNRENAVLSYDECDHMIRNLRILNVLKIATDTKNTDKILSYKARNKKLCIEPFLVRCRFVFLTNTDLRSKALIGDRKLGEHIKAFNSRCVPYVMSFDHEALYEYTCYLVVCERMLMKKGHSREVTELALSYFSETMNRVTDVSPRSVSQIADEIERNPAHWRELLEQTLDQPWRKPPIWVPRLEPRRSTTKSTSAIISASTGVHR